MMVVGVHDVAATLRHLLVVLAENHALVDELLKRLGHADDAAVVEHLVPEARVEKVEHGVLGAADVQIDRHPGFFIARVDRERSRFSDRESAGSTSTSRPIAAWYWFRGGRAATSRRQASVGRRALLPRFRS